MFDEDDLDEVALAARRVIADGLPLTGGNLAKALSTVDEPDSVGLTHLVDGIVDGLGREPDPGIAVIDIGHSPMSDLRREIERRGLTVVTDFGSPIPPGTGVVVLVGWAYADFDDVSAGLNGDRNLVIACRREDDIDEAWRVVDSITEANVVLDQATPGVVEFKAITLPLGNDDLSRAIDEFRAILSQRGLIVAGPGVTGAELEAYLPFLGAGYPSIKLVNAESVAAVEEVREAMGLGFAVNICFDFSRPDRMNPGLAGIS